MVLELAIATVWVLVSVWVYWDAKRSDNDSPLLWAGFVFLTAVFGFYPLGLVLGTFAPMLSLYIYILQERRRKRRERERSSYGETRLNR
ncbi:MAG: hypothetical protein U5J64_09775 [Halobacteriales archaeon]|nr:hypothetical protein [Halobacteriales archaeon]